jgi:enoyl-CoA hydratase
VTAEPEILLDVQGELGRIMLNRPKALNSLTLGMIRTMAETLRRWRDDERVRAILIEGAGERGLCAGGDIRALYESIKAGDWSFPATFWAEEYRLNAALSHYPKPVVGIMDGICMGGGIGITAHGSHRVVTERSKVGMPEVGIGFVPDVGGTYLLSRAPGELGTHLALTGEAVGGADAIHCGLADYYVPSERLGELADGLAAGSMAALQRCAVAPQAPLASERRWMDDAYSASTMEKVLQRLRERGEEKAQRAAENIATKSPVALKVTLRSLRSARAFTSLEQALDQEYRVSLACARFGDLAEGVRAALVDKDRDPKWSPNRLEAVDDDRVERFFAPLGERELGLASA